MPFPFIPGGALLALAVLGGAMALFGVALRALDWTIDTARGSMLGGIVSGLRGWEQRQGKPDPGATPPSTQSSAPPQDELPPTEEIGAAAAVEVERVTSSRSHRAG